MIQQIQGLWQSQVTGTQKPLPPKLLVYGVPKVGKSTFLAAMPKPIVIDFDDGLTAIRVDSVNAKKKIRTWRDLIVLLGSIAAAPGEYKTLGIDTIDGLEELAITHVCEVGKKDKLADFDWGGGYEALQGEWRYMISLLDQARDNGMAICLLAHSQVKETNDPRIGKYDTFTPLLQKKTWATTHKWADAILFAAVDAKPIGDEKRAFVSGKRILHTTTGTGFIAGNRWSLPATLPLNWPTVQSNIDSDKLREQIRALAGEPLKEKAETFITEAGENIKELQIILASLREKVATP